MRHCSLEAQSVRGDWERSGAEVRNLFTSYDDIACIGTKTLHPEPYKERNESARIFVSMKFIRSLWWCYHCCSPMSWTIPRMWSNMTRSSQFKYQSIYRILKPCLFTPQANVVKSFNRPSTTHTPLWQPSPVQLLECLYCPLMQRFAKAKNATRLLPVW